jgi:hypothetical protein
VVGVMSQLHALTGGFACEGLVTSTYAWSPVLHTSVAVRDRAATQTVLQLSFNRKAPETAACW